MLHLVFYYEATDALRALGAVDIYSERQPIEAFFDRISHAPGFHVDDAPFGMRLRYSTV